MWATHEGSQHRSLSFFVGVGLAPVRSEVESHLSNRDQSLVVFFDQRNSCVQVLFVQTIVTFIRYDTI